jgi:large subunit ribosomal protein L31
VKTDIHPRWYNEANVVCASCGNTWTTGATIPEIKTDICSNCHPFYTGEQRIVDTEGRVDVFMRRLKRRDEMIAEDEQREAERTPMNLPIHELDLSDRYLNILQEHNINTVSDFLEKLEESGDESILELPGIGRKVLADLKKSLRSRGYDIPVTE